MYEITEPFKKGKKKKKKKKLVSYLVRCANIYRAQFYFYPFLFSLLREEILKKRGKYFVPELSTYEDVGGFRVNVNVQINFLIKDPLL